jgi:uncharacterized membrane protein YgcG
MDHQQRPNALSFEMVLSPKPEDRKDRSAVKMILICLFVGAIVVVSFAPCWPFSVIVRWSQNTESDLAGYKVYHGTESRLYDTSVDAGMVTFQEISGLIEGVTYYFAVTAYNAGGVESYFSEEVSFLEPEADGEGGGGGSNDQTGGGGGSGCGGGCFIDVLQEVWD